MLKTTNKAADKQIKKLRAEGQHKWLHSFKKLNGNVNSFRSHCKILILIITCKSFLKNK